MANLVEIIVTAKDLAGPAIAKSQAEVARLQAAAERSSLAAAASGNRRRQLEADRERLYQADRASAARRADGEITAAQRRAERDQIASARRANTQQIAAARQAEREETAAARRASAQIGAAQREQAARAEASAGRMRDAMGGVALALGAIGVESIKMASKFDSEMTLLETQAGVAKDQMGFLKKGVLDLAGKVGQDPDSLAEALFHVESNFESMGISSSKALKLTETAAKGATLGHADLVDVTNALTAAVASGIPGVKGFDQAMGVLNATVGVGDMKMQDLASAFSTGMLAVVKSFGLSIQDVGAALAVFGDNNKRGAAAATDLRMSVMALGKPVATAGDQLKRLHMTTGTLADDMRKGGLKLALEDLIDRFKKAGITGKEQGQVITDLFGRKAGAGLTILIDQFDRLETKYPKLEEGAHKFGGAWKDTQKTFAFQMKSLQGDFDALMIRIGEKLMPVVMKFVDFLKGPFAEAVGPLASAAFKIMEVEGGVALAALTKGFKVASPVLKDFAAGIQAATEYFAPFAREAMHAGAAILDAIVPSTKVNQMEGPFARLRDAIRANKGAIQEEARGMANGILTMAEVAIQNLPIVTKLFRLLSVGVLESMGVIVDGMAKIFGHLPMIGGKFKAAAKDFDTFKANFVNGINTADSAAASFARTAVPKLEQNRLKLNISNWEAQIATAKNQIKSVPPEKQAALKAKISDLESKVGAAKAKLASIKDRTAAIKARDQASGTIGMVQRMLNSLHDTFVTVHTSYTESHTSSPFRASGGPIHLAGGGMPGGGRIAGPGTSTSDSIPTMLSNGEYVIKASSVQKYGEKFMDALNEGRLHVAGYAKGGKLTKAQKAAKAQAKAESQARHDAMGDLSISHFGWMAGWRRDEFQHALGSPDSLGSLVSALNQWRNTIMKATHGSTETRLLKQLDSAGKQLMKWEKQLNSVTANLSKARDKLASLKDAAASLRDSVKSNLLSSTAITRGAGPDSPVTLSSIRAGMTVSRDKVTAFASALKQLKAKGFSKSIIQQVAEAGIDGGGLETAGALLQASASEVKTINQTQATIDKAATSAGKTAADVVYGKAIKQQERYVKTLTEQQKKLTTSMDKLAKAIEKSIKDAFGSGKKKGKATGGIGSGLTMVGEQGFELLDLPTGSRVWSNPDSRRMLAQGQAPWASMLSAPRASHYAPAGPAASDQPIVIQVRLGDREFGELWVDAGRRAVRARGSIEATLKPPRGR